MAIQGFILYKFYYTIGLVYLGRTKQSLQNRIRGHVFKKPMHRSIDINLVTKIEYAEFKSEADMNLYEIYFINLYKPPFNVDDKCKDSLSVTLPEVEWKEYKCHLWEKWVNEINSNNSEFHKKLERKHDIIEEIRILRGRYKIGEISKEQTEKELEKLKSEKVELDRYFHC